MIKNRRSLPENLREKIDQIREESEIFLKPNEGPLFEADGALL